MNYEMGRIWNKVVVTDLKALIEYLIEDNEEKYRKTLQDSPSPGSEFNPQIPNTRHEC
jgi:hypothetical protein